MIPRAALPSVPPRAPRPVDPDRPTGTEPLLFDMPRDLAESRVVVVPVSYEATVSGGRGTIDAPGAVVEASREIDFDDPVAGEAWRAGIALLPEPREIRETAARAGEAVRGHRAGAAGRAAEADACAAELAAWLGDATSRLIAGGRTPIVLGGEHGIVPGAIAAAARERPGLGVLHVDAHGDLREAYEGLRSSHASALRRVAEEPRVRRIVQVGLRDLSREESRAAAASGGRIVWHTDASIAARLHRGVTFDAIAREAVGALPDDVWVTFDVDGLDPSLCPRTGTPVPGGLDWREACTLLLTLARTGRRLVGADVVETGAAPWDALVAARLVYVLAGLAAGTART